MRIITLVLIVLSQTIVLAQDGRFERIYVTPGISVGYTFGATFNIGVDLDLTTSITNDFDKTRRAGISISHYLVLSKGGFQPHHISSLNLMFENKILDIKKEIQKQTQETDEEISKIDAIASDQVNKYITPTVSALDSL